MYFGLAPPSCSSIDQPPHSEWIFPFLFAADTSLHENKKAGIATTIMKSPMSTYPVSTGKYRAQPRSVTTPKMPKSNPPKKSVLPPVCALIRLISCPVKERLYRREAPNKAPMTAKMIMVPIPKRRPGRNPVQGLVMAEAATVLIKRENPPNPKPAMKP